MFYLIFFPIKKFRRGAINYLQKMVDRSKICSLVAVNLSRLVRRGMRKVRRGSWQILTPLQQAYIWR